MPTRLLSLITAALMIASVANAGPARGTEPGPRHERVVMDDGVALDGWVWLPEAARAARVPTVLVFSMYWGNLDPPGNSPPTSVTRVADAGLPRTVVPTQRLLDEGYAVAFFNVRGTGDSDGCFTYTGERDGLDGAALVEWLASQPWSDGHVGMAGFSQDAMEAMATATLAPPSLDAVVAMAPGVDPFLGMGTPNGQLGAIWSAGNVPVNVAAGAGPPVYRSADGAPYGDPAWATSWPERVTDRWCPDVEQGLRNAVAEPHADQRDEAFWTERRWSDRFPNVRAAVLASMGVADSTVGGFGMDAVGFGLLRSPKAMIVGQWGHVTPPVTPAEPWDDLLVAWFDHFLRNGGGRPAITGEVWYQTDDRSWHVTRAWGERQEVFELGGGDRQYTSVLAATSGTPVSPCAEDGRTSLLYEVGAVLEPTDVAGAGFAYLHLASSAPAGSVGVQLLELDAAFSCAANPNAFTPLAFGGADLRFHDGSFDADPFPVGDSQWIRIDLEAVAQCLDPGHRLGLVVANLDPTYHSGHADAPTITILPDSQLVLPVAAGSLGGVTPTLDYPPRPNLPGSGR